MMRPKKFGYLRSRRIDYRDATTSVFVQSKKPQELGSECLPHSPSIMKERMMSPVTSQPRRQSLWTSFKLRRELLSVAPCHPRYPWGSAGGDSGVDSPLCGGVGISEGVY